jgi:hypothetical protein
MTVRALSFVVLGFFLFAMQGCVDCAGIYKKATDCTSSKTQCTDCKTEYNALKDICGCKCKDIQTTDIGKTACDVLGNPDLKSTTLANSKLCKDGDTTAGTGDAMCP